LVGEIHKAKRGFGREQASAEEYPGMLSRDKSGGTVLARPRHEI
jgi:hypothetical protein